MYRYCLVLLPSSSASSACNGVTSCIDLARRTIDSVHTHLLHISSDRNTRVPSNFPTRFSATNITRGTRRRGEARKRGTKTTQEWKSVRAISCADIKSSPNERGKLVNRFGNFISFHLLFSILRWDIPMCIQIIRNRRIRPLCAVPCYRQTIKQSQMHTSKSLFRSIK